MKNAIRFFALTFVLAILAAITFSFTTPAAAQMIKVDLAQPILPDGYVLENSIHENTSEYQFNLGSLKQWRFQTQNSFPGCVSGEEIYEYLYDDAHPERLDSFLGLREAEAILERLQHEPDGGVGIFKKLYGSKFPFSWLPFTWDSRTAIYFWRSVALDHAADERKVTYMKIKRDKKGKEELVLDWSPVSYDCNFSVGNPALKFNK